MRRGLTFFIFTLAAISLAWAADAPWKGKPYDQWNDKDLERVFGDSPWARISTIVRTWNSASSGSGTSSAGNDSRRAAGGANPAGRGAPQSGSNAPETDDLNFYVHWASSRVMRAASARKAVLHGGKADLDVAKYASQPQDEYQISVQSEDMSPFLRHDEKFYQANSFLELKKSKTKISPTHVSYERDDKGVSTAVFFFPKKTASGDPIISDQEKNVEFSTKIEGATLRVTFEPQKMIDSLGSDL